MSLESALLRATSGIRHTSRQIEVTSQNVANAGVEGYTRKTVAGEQFDPARIDPVHMGVRREAVDEQDRVAVGRPLLEIGDRDSVGQEGFHRHGSAAGLGAEAAGLHRRHRTGSARPGKATRRYGCHPDSAPPPPNEQPEILTGP